MYRLLAFALSALLLLAAAATALAYDGPLAYTGEERAFVEAGETLKVGYVQDRIPVSFSDADGELGGISRAIFDRVAELSGLKFEYAALPNGPVTYDYLIGEGFDMVTSVEFNKENLGARGILMSNPYLSSRKVIVARENLEFRYDIPLSVAVSTGSQTLRKVLHDIYPNFELKDYDSIDACFRAVLHGEADLMIQNQYVVEYWIAKPAYEKLKVIPVLGLEDQLCFSAVVDFTGEGEPTQERGEMIIGILNKAIEAIGEDEIGSYTIQAVMENQYDYTLGDFLNRYRYAVGVFTVAVLIISALSVLLVRQRMRSMADRAEAKAQGEFLSTMSHEIRTPLNGLIGLNYLMTQKLDDKERLADYLRQSTATAKYLLSLVSDILDISKLQEGKTALVLQPVDLELLVAAVGTMIKSGMHEKEIDFQVEARLPYPCVLGDEVRIQQVMMNLLDNARKFTPPGGHVALRVEQSLDARGRVLTRAEVADDGRGMSAEFQKKVFDSFAQELDTVSKGNQGTGLGLAICHRLAKLMDGDLTFTSGKDKGSSFVFTFPGERAARPDEKPAQAEDAARPRILVAEDNELNAEIMMDLLKEEGFEAVLAPDGQEALRVFSASPAGFFGVILMDLLMPRMDGFEATAAIRALQRPDAKTVRIIACTANSLAQDRQKALDSGMDDFIAKPINITALMAKLYG